MTVTREFFTKRVAITIPSWIGLILILGAIGLIVWFIAAPSHRSVVIFITSLAAAFGLMLNAINGIFTRQAQTEQAERLLQTQGTQAAETIRQYRRHEALDFMKRWNDPQFAQLRAPVNLGIEKDQKFVTLQSPPEIGVTTHLILNFLEMLAIAYWKEELDRDLCKEFFRSVLIYYEKRLSWYMDEFVKIRNQPSAWENFRKLAASWRA